MADSIAERQLLLSGPRGERHDVRVSIETPRAVGDDWACRVSVLVDGSDWLSVEAFGVDSMQALVNALQLPAHAVSNLESSYNGRCTWLDGEELGLAT